MLEADYLATRGCKYKHGGAKDTDALKALMAVATDEEIRARWAAALVATGWPNCSTFAQLGMKWNDLAAPPPRSANQRPAYDPNGGITRQPFLLPDELETA